MKILRLLWEIIFPFDIEWRLKQQALQTPDHAHLPPLMVERLDASGTYHLTAVKMVEVLEPSESQAGNVLAKRVAA